LLVPFLYRGLWRMERENRRYVALEKRIAEMIWITSTLESSVHAQWYRFIEQSGKTYGDLNSCHRSQSGALE